MARVFTTLLSAEEYLMRDGNFRVPCSRYGHDTITCVPWAWDVAVILRDEQGGGVITAEHLDYYMGLVVNDSDEVAYLVDTYGEKW